MLVERLCVCPGCFARLTHAASARELSCTGCHARFPIVDGVPVLLANPNEYLAEVSKQYERTIASREGVIKKLALASKDEDVAFRAPLMKRVIAASEANVALLRRLHGPIASHVSTAGAVPSASTPRATESIPDARYGPGALHYLRMDWSGDPETEEHIRHVESVLLRQAQRYCDRDGAAVVLGAGGGRYLFDLAAHFASMVGVDLSYPFVQAFHRLAVEDLSAALIELVAPYSRDKMVMEFTARMPADRGQLDRLVYVAADALELPLASQSVSTVIMTFFNDVVPLPLLLAEIKRVLAPNGRVLSFGTLNYHFNDVAWFLAPEEAEEVIMANGFAFEEQSWSDVPLSEQPRSYSRSYRVWSYVLRRQG